MPSDKEPFAFRVNMRQAATREGHIDRVANAETILGAADADVRATNASPLKS